MRLAVPVVIAGGCFAAVLTATGAVAQDIKIGTIYDLTGPFAGGGSKPAFLGNKIAIDMINEKGGVEGHKIVPIFADAQSKIDVAINEAERLLNEQKVDVLMGVYSSAQCVPMAGKVDAAKKFLWLNVCVSSAVFKDKGLTYAFRPTIHSDQYGDATCSYVHENAKKFGKETKDIKIAITPEDVAAAETATRELNADFLTVMLEGRYTDAYLEQAGGDAPAFTDDELKSIASPLDFAGINVYRPHVYVQPSDEPPGYRVVPFNASHPKMHASWHIFAPEVMYWAPRQVQSLWGAQSIFITENGCAAADVVSSDGKVYDSDRVMFLRGCLEQLQRATSEGVPVDGYFHWSSQDNFEWVNGFGDRFGLIYVNFDTLERTPKLSAQWFREAARHNAVV